MRFGKNIYWASKCLIDVNVVNCRSSHPEVFCKKGVLRNFAKFTGKHLRRVFSCEFWEISKNTFSYRTSPVAASETDSILI